ncbi:aldehyde dehydrogenase family protein [Photobacterium swingsii]|uniref:aldehyde dehydrogenase family protein n=1 Tax=Photobacterium swingsii TaxID=680026 RepID=UPI004068BE13
MNQQVKQIFKTIDDKHMGVYETVAEAIEQSAIAQIRFQGECSLEARNRIIAAIRQAILDCAGSLGEMAVEESGLGRVDHKIAKNQLAATATPGTECLQTHAISSDDGLTIEERSPFGLIGAVTPVTNEVPTIVSNAISMIAGGNAVVFNVHPSAKMTSAVAIDRINRAVIAEGGPADLVTMVKEPTLDTLQEIAKAPEVRLLVGTGGPGLVNALLRSGKKAIGAGAGNPPVVVDETADIELAAASIVAGASFDNNLLCIGEKEVFVVEQQADALIGAMKKSRAYLLTPAQAQQVTDLVLTADQDDETAKGCSFGMEREYHLRKEWVGQDAAKILTAIGVDHSEPVDLLIFEALVNNPFVQLEQMMPVLPIVRCRDFSQAMTYAVDAEHGNRHSACIYSNNVNNVTTFAKRIGTTVFTQNGPTLVGLGYGGAGTTSFTIAGPTGEGITTARDFTRVRRFAIAQGGNRII